jgi:hypothetical protein
VADGGIEPRGERFFLLGNQAPLGNRSGGSGRHRRGPGVLASYEPEDEGAQKMRRKNASGLALGSWS